MLRQPRCGATALAAARVTSGVAMGVAVMVAVMVAGTTQALAASRAEAVAPGPDAQVVQRLPHPTQRVVRGSAAAPLAAQAAAAAARTLIEQGRRDGDPREVGRALTLLAPWRDDPQAAAEIVLLLAQAEQHLHRFDAAEQRLAALVARDALQPQAWLMLATLKRLGGRYTESSADCEQLLRLGATLHGEACQAENAALRGQWPAARAQLQGLIAGSTDAPTRAWLYTTLAEAEQRAGRPAQAEAAFQAALRSDPSDSYAAVALADQLLAATPPRAREAMAALALQPASDAALLRRVQAARHLRLPLAEPWSAELSARMAQAAERGSSGHERERAQAALVLGHDARAALALARLNLRTQREPADLWLLAQAGRAAGDAAAVDEARALARAMGLVDVRLR